MSADGHDFAPRLSSSLPKWTRVHFPLSASGGAPAFPVARAHSLPIHRQWATLPCYLSPYLRRSGTERSCGRNFSGLGRTFLTLATRQPNDAGQQCMCACVRRLQDQSPSALRTGTVPFLHCRRLCLFLISIFDTANAPFFDPQFFFIFLFLKRALRVSGVRTSLPRSTLT